MKFNFEKYLIFWKLRDIVTAENILVEYLEPIGGRKMTLDNGKKKYTIIYHLTSNGEYRILTIQVIETDPVLGTAVETITGEYAQKVLDEI